MSLVLENICYTLPQKVLLDNISLDIEAGKVTLLIGPNGAGKSTLLKVCSGDIRPTQGDIKLNQKPLNEYDSQTLARHRAVMTQNYSLSFGFTVDEIITMGCFVYEGFYSQADQKQAVKEVMAFMQVDRLAEQNFLTLSGGEQQRVQLARVLTQLWLPEASGSPRYLFLDEPTSSLDIFYQYQVLELAKTLTEKNIGVLAVIHDLSLAASYADKLVLLSKGAIETQGSPKNVLARKHLHAVYGINGDYYRSSEETMPCVLIEKPF